MITLKDVTDLALDVYNDYMLLYRIFGDEWYREFAELILEDLRIIHNNEVQLFYIVR